MGYRISDVFQQQIVHIMDLDINKDLKFTLHLLENSIINNLSNMMGFLNNKRVISQKLYLFFILQFRLHSLNITADVLLFLLHLLDLRNLRNLWNHLLNHHFYFCFEVTNLQVIILTLLYFLDLNELLNLGYDLRHVGLILNLIWDHYVLLVKLIDGEREFPYQLRN